MTYDDQQLVEDIKSLMKQRKVSARAMSASIGVPYRSIQNYLSGKSRFPAIVMISMLDHLGADIRMLRHGDNLLRHADIYDAVHRVLGDQLLKIDVSKLGRKSRPGGLGPTPEDIELAARRNGAASEIAVQLSEAYDEFVRDHRVPGHMPTIKELRAMSAQRRKKMVENERD